MSIRLEKPTPKYECLVSLNKARRRFAIKPATTGYGPQLEAICDGLGTLEEGTTMGFPNEYLLTVENQFFNMDEVGEWLNQELNGLFNGRVRWN